MINSSPIPSPELIEKLKDLCNLVAIEVAYRAGADQELEACCMWITREKSVLMAEELGIARRPKPPSLKEQALEALEQLLRDPEAGCFSAAPDTLRRALEALPND
jgi:hypothetical protein